MLRCCRTTNHNSIRVRSRNAASLAKFGATPHGLFRGCLAGRGDTQGCNAVRQDAGGIFRAHSRLAAKGDGGFRCLLTHNVEKVKKSRHAHRRSRFRHRPPGGQRQRCMHGIVRADAERQPAETCKPWMRVISCRSPCVFCGKCRIPESAIREVFKSVTHVVG